MLSNNQQATINYKSISEVGDLNIISTLIIGGEMMVIANVNPVMTTPEVTKVFVINGEPEFNDHRSDESLNSLLIIEVIF